MFFRLVVIALLGSSDLIEGVAAGIVSSRSELGTNVIVERAEPTCLNANALQSASDLTGQESGTDGIKPGQAPSAM